MIKLTPKRPRAFVIEPSRMRLDILNALRKEGTQHKRLLRKTVRTWRGAKPKFETEIHLRRDDIIVNTHPTGSKEAVNKWNWLDGGTSIRWALMSSDWRSKTKPRWMSSRAGRGNVVIAGRRAMRRRNIRPRPGIKARHWIPEIVRRREARFARQMKREFEVMSKELRR